MCGNSNKMTDSSLKLNQIVDEKQIRTRYWSQIHKITNSLKQSASYSSQCQQQEPYYESRLPQVGFHRKDLSLILRYVLQKQETTVSDRNLLRRILLANFPEELVTAGSKKAVTCLTLLEGKGHLELHQRQFFFLLKGRGRVFTQDYSYTIEKGMVFGDIQILSGCAIRAVEFQSHYLMLALNQQDFDLFYRPYFEKLYEEKRRELSSIEVQFLVRIPDITRYLLLQQVEYKTFLQGEQIVALTDKVTAVYFVELEDRYKQKGACKGCLGLYQVLHHMPTYLETVVCPQKKLRVPFLRVQAFRTYVLDVLGPESLDNKSMADLNKSCLSLSTVEIPLQKPKLSSFMRQKKIKLTMNKARAKMMTQYFETKFTFLKPGQTDSTLHTHLSQLCSRRAQTTLKSRLEFHQNESLLRNQGLSKRRAETSLSREVLSRSLSRSTKRRAF